MNDRLKNLFIGLFVLIAIAIAITIILFLEPTVGDGKKTLHVRFSNLSGINIGTRVTFSGRPVGEVVAIHEVFNSRDGPVDSLGRVYIYQLTLKIDSSVEVYNTDEITISSMGLMGEKSIAIIPKAPPKNVVPKLITNQILYADSVDPFEQALHEVSQVANEFETAIKDFNQWFMENSDDLTKSVQSFSGAMHQLDTALQTVNQENLIVAVKKGVDAFTGNMLLMQDTFLELQETDTVGKLNTLLENFALFGESLNTDGRNTLHNLSLITDNVFRGCGTLGKLVSNDDFYLRVMSLLSKAETLMNDVNHYGLLFQYNKQWQRLRTKRASLLESLATPSDFQNFFETEVDAINTALSRLNLLLEKADQPGEKARIMNSAAFRSDFYQLLKKVEELSSNLKSYNENLMEGYQPPLPCPNENLSPCSDRD